jgi:hypothetical protein
MMSRQNKLLNALCGVFLACGGAPAFAHVPYFEHFDFSEKRPFIVRDSIEQSIAVYSWIKFNDNAPATDVDVYEFNINEPVQVYIESLVPVCAGYEEFLPWFALVGPGLPEPLEDLPFDIPDDYGAIVVPNLEPGEPRGTFFEPFGGKRYYEGPVFQEEVTTPGTYYAVFWDPYELGGDYVAVLGNEEIWRPRDIIRALIYTPKIRQDLELHIECE